MEKAEKEDEMPMHWKFYDACCGNRLCACLFPYTGCGWCIYFFLVLGTIIGFWATVLTWNAVFSGFVSPWFAFDMREEIPIALQTGDFSKVQSAYEYRLWLGESVLVLGSPATSAAEFVDSRGTGVEEVAIRFDQKMPIASGSKLFSAVVIYAVIEHPLTNITASSTPGEYFPFWTCSDPTAVKCQNITIEKLLAFRSGLASPGCERSQFAGVTWEDCVEGIFNVPYNPSSFDGFFYGPVGLTIAGLMALKEMQKLPGYGSATWDDIMKDLVLDVANITDAPTYDKKFYKNGRMTYDYQFVSHEGKDPYNEDFPDLSASLGCSPRQYAQFLFAFLGNKIVSDFSVNEITRSHGGVGEWYGAVFEHFESYGQGMWIGRNGITHSVGFYGFYPWLVQDDPNPDNHYFGIVATNNRVYFPWAMEVLVFTLSPFLFSGMCFSIYYMVQSRSRVLAQRNLLDN